MLIMWGPQRQTPVCRIRNQARGTLPLSFSPPHQLWPRPYAHLVVDCHSFRRFPRLYRSRDHNLTVHRASCALQTSRYWTASVSIRNVPIFTNQWACTDQICWRRCFFGTLWRQEYWRGMAPKNWHSDMYTDRQSTSLLSILYIATVRIMEDLWLASLINLEFDEQYFALPYAMIYSAVYCICGKGAPIFIFLLHSFIPRYNLLIHDTVYVNSMLSA